MEQNLKPLECENWLGVQRLVASLLGIIRYQKVHFSHVTSRGQPQTPSRSRTSSEALAVHSALQAECTASIWPYEHLMLELCSCPREVTQRCATRSTSNHLVLPHQQGTAAVPAVPSRSSVAERPAMRASHRPCTTIFMLQRVHRRP